MYYMKQFDDRSEERGVWCKADVDTEIGTWSWRRQIVGHSSFFVHRSFSIFFRSLQVDSGRRRIDTEAGI